MVHTLSHVRYATQLRGCTNCAQGFLNSTKPSKLAFHGSISPCPGVHAGTFLIFIWHNSTVSRQLRYALSQEYVCTPSPALTSLTLWQNVCGDVCAPVAGAYVLLCCEEM